MPLLYDIPRSLLADVDAGKVELFNAILKDVATGRIVGHVQQTNALEAPLGSAFQGAQVTLSSGFGPLGSFLPNRTSRSDGASEPGTAPSGCSRTFRLGRSHSRASAFASQ